MSVKGFRPASKKKKQQMGAVLFGNMLVHEVILAVGQELQEVHGWEQKATADFVQGVVARVKTNTGQKQPPDAAATPSG
jgi:hypothetical protein